MNTTSIAMWSGPRNISTALMRAWENRRDTFVTDEPLYAHYLAATGTNHPGRDEVIASGEIDLAESIATLTAPNPEGASIWYQKHMCHHLLPGMERAWILRLVNCFLIRRPAEVLASYMRRRDSVTMDDLGYVQQAELLDMVVGECGSQPPVIDAHDVLLDPRRVLTRLCATLDVPFSERMLAWPAGHRKTDGVWSKHWYQAVERSTGFIPPRHTSAKLPRHLQGLADACEPYYRALYRNRLR